MKFQGALIKEQGVTFGIVSVKPHVLRSSSEADSMRRLGNRVFGPVPVILMAQDSRGVPTYLGRQDIVKFLAKVPLWAISWHEYTLN